MSAGDILSSAEFWILIGICILCGWYAKRNLVDGIIFGGVAPLILVPLWFVVTFALVIPYAILLKLAPGVITWSMESSASWTGEMAMLLHPATLITAILFFIFCRSERASSGLPSGYRPKSRQRNDHNPYSRTFR